MLEPKQKWKILYNIRNGGVANYSMTIKCNREITLLYQQLPSTAPLIAQQNKSKKRSKSEIYIYYITMGFDIHFCSVQIPAICGWNADDASPTQPVLLRADINGRSANDKRDAERPFHPNRQQQKFFSFNNAYYFEAFISVQRFSGYARTARARPEYVPILLELWKSLINVLRPFHSILLARNRYKHGNFPCGYWI